MLAVALLAHAGEERGGDVTPGDRSILPPLEVPLVPQGYAFDQPELLVEQRLWGIAHGVRLLALACARNGHAAAAESGVDWLEREAAPLHALTARLGLHYFRREDVPLDAIATALGLRQSLDLSPEALRAACDTLAEALAQPRYDLTRRRTEMLNHDRR